MHRTVSRIRLTSMAYRHAAPFNGRLKPFIILLFFFLLFFADPYSAVSQNDGEGIAGSSGSDSSAADSSGGLSRIEEPVQVAVLNNFPPFSFTVREKLMGFTIDYLQLISRKTGLEFNFVEGTWKDNITRFKEGEVDLITAISYTEERTEFTRYTTSYYIIPTVVYTRENTFTYQSIEDLEGKVVGIEENVYYKQYLEEYPKITLKEVEDTNALLKQLSFDELDAVITNINIGNYMKQKHMLENVQMAGRVNVSGIEDEDLRIGVQREKRALHSLVQEGMNRISPHEYKELQDRWVGFTPDSMERILTPEENELINQYSKQHGGIRVGFHRDWYPVDFLNDRNAHDGIAAEVFSGAAGKHDIPLRSRVTTSFREAVRAVAEGRADILPAVLPSEQLRGELSITKPYLSLPLAIATRSSEFFIGELDNIDGKRVSLVPRGETRALLMKKYPDITFRRVQSVKEGLERVRNEIDFAFIGTIPTIAYGIQQHNFYNIKISGTLEEKLSISAAVAKGNQKLLSIFEKVLSDIDASERKEIVNQWVSVSLEERVDYTIILRIFGAVILGVIVVFLWIRKVKAYNKKISKVNLLLEQKNRELERLSVTDRLTGLYNRNKIDVELQNEINRSKRSKRPFSVLLLDIDYFKHINDQDGHQAGDRVLEEISALLRARVRASDTPGRWGGEEFLIICPETGIEGASRLAEEIRQEVENYSFPVNRKITVSIGIAEYRGEEQVDDLIRRGDNNLYTAKEEGRNRVVGGEV